MSTDVQPASDGDNAQVVAMGESKFGILWNGRLRAEEYPTQTVCPFGDRRAAARQHGWSSRVSSLF
jgi:hypothetical protein